MRDGRVARVTEKAGSPKNFDDGARCFEKSRPELCRQITD